MNSLTLKVLSLFFIVVATVATDDVSESFKYKYLRGNVFRHSGVDMYCNWGNQLPQSVTEDINDDFTHESDCIPRRFTETLRERKSYTAYEDRKTEICQIGTHVCLSGRYANNFNVGYGCVSSDPLKLASTKYFYEQRCKAIPACVKDNPDGKPKGGWYECNDTKKTEIGEQAACNICGTVSYTVPSFKMLIVTVLLFWDL